MNGVLALHEVLHETKKNRSIGIVLKLDFQKAYDKVCWEFLFENLKIRGFDKKWCQWMKQVVSGETLSVKINDKMGAYFASHKGVRQGEPLSPILFNLVADCLTRMIRKSQDNGLIIGLANNLIPKGVAVLQYADDTIICLKDGMENARNMKSLLYWYEMMSGLKINFTKSEVILINGDENTNVQMAELFNYQIGMFTIKYLGVPVSPCRLHVEDWEALAERNEKKLMVWKGGVMSIAGRTTLINSSLTSSAINHMSMYLLPKTTTDRLDKQRRVFFWQGGSTKRKYRLLRWGCICKSKKNGGLGIKDIRKMNISMLCKWWWKLENEDGLWQQVVIQVPTWGFGEYCETQTQ
jgi:hypothetical protein